jgi:hypothetical protein
VELSPSSSIELAGLVQEGEGRRDPGAFFSSLFSFSFSLSLLDVTYTFPLAYKRGGRALYEGQAN